MLSRINSMLVRIRGCTSSPETGQALSEYGLVLGLVAVVAVFALSAVGLAVSGELGAFAGAFGGS